MMRKALAATVFVLGVVALTPASLARSNDHGGHHSQTSQSTNSKESAGGNGTAAKNLKKLPGKRKPPTLTLH